MRSVRLRLILFFNLLFVGFALFFSIFLFKIVQDYYSETLTNRLIKETNLIADLTSTQLTLLSDNEALGAYVNQLSDNMDARMTFIALDGRVLADSLEDETTMENHASRPEVKDAMNKKVGVSRRYSTTVDSEMIYVAVPIMAGDVPYLIIRTSIPYREIQKTIQQNLWLPIGLTLIVVLLLIGLISSRIAGGISRPLEEMTKVAKAISNRDYQKRVEVHTNDEVGQLGEAINMMAQSLNEQIYYINENERRLKGVLDHMANGLLLIGVTGRIILVNPAIERLLGYKTKELLGKYHIEAGHSYILSQYIEKCMETGETIHEEVNIYYPLERILDANLAPIYNDKQEITGVLVVVHDITNIRRLERMRSEFVANVSHELRTPVTAVKGFAETLLDGALEDPETSRHFIEIIYQESDRLHRLISDILDLSKIESKRAPLEYTHFSLSSVITSTIVMMKGEAEKRGLKMMEDVREGVMVEADKDRVQQIIVNLLSNAIAYTP
ncbi:MAG: histidine kinase dimerization/phospho-acceptor domain-containing protein, partial [Bacilli bacterium]